MGCCQPMEQISYDVSSEDVLKSYHLSSSAHYRNSTIRSPIHGGPMLLETSLKTTPPKKDVREMRLNEFQTPTERNNRYRQWNANEQEVNNLVLAFKNEDLKYLFEYVKNEDFVDETGLIIEHKWAVYPRTMGSLACALITSILGSYINEEVHPEVLNELRSVIITVFHEQSFIVLLSFFREMIDKKRFFLLEHGFLMINSLLVFYEVNPKDSEFLIKMLVDFLLVFNSGFKERKVEMGLLTLETLQKIHEHNKPSVQISEHGLSIVKTFWLIYDISIELYTFDEQLIIWFRLLNFLDEVSKNKGKRIQEYIEKFKMGNIKDLLISIKMRITQENSKVKEMQPKNRKFEPNLLEYLSVLFLDLNL